MPVKIEDFLGTTKNYQGDIAAYELQKAKDLKVKSYQATPGETGIAIKHWDKSTDISPAGKFTNNAISGVMDLSKDPNLSSPEFVGLDSYAKGIGDIYDKLKSGGGLDALWEGISKVADQGLEFLREETQIRNTINSEMGVTGKLGNDIRDTIMMSAPLAYKFGFGVKDITEQYTKLNKETGRFNLVSKEILEKSFATSRAFGLSLGDMGETYAQFERVGVGFGDTLKTLDQIGTKSLRLGLTGKDTIKDVRANLEKVNEYGFKNGIQGLAEMSRIAKIFRVDMSDAFTVADKVMNPEGAVELSAKLQVLGGVLGDFNDPIKLMYESTNNVEALQKAMISLTKDLATYNAEQGKFEITGANILRAREISSITGVSLKDITQSAVAANEKIRGLQELSLSPLRSASPEEKEFLLNLAHMEHGEMRISIPDSLKEQFKAIGQNINADGTVAIKNLKSDSSSLIKAYQDEFKTMNPEEIARGQYTTLQNISHDVASITAYFRARMVQAGSGLTKGLGLEQGAQTVATALNLKTTKFLEGIESGVKFTKDVNDNISKALNFFSFGLLDKAKKALLKADEEYRKEIQIEQDKKRKATTGGSPAAPDTGSDIENTLYNRVTNRRDNSAINQNSTSKSEVTLRILPSDTTSHVWYQALMRDQNVAQNFVQNMHQDSYLNMS